MGTKYQGNKKEVEALNAFIKLNRATDTVLASTSSVYSDAGLTESQFAVLELLYHTGPCSQLEIGQRILKTKGNITMVVRNLERNNYVTRCRSEEDKRYYSVSITPKGRKLISSIFPEHAQGITKVMSVLTDKELLDLSRICKKLGLANLAA